jgi:hypothetical protein
MPMSLIGLIKEGFRRAFGKETGPFDPEVPKTQ